MYIKTNIFLTFSIGLLLCTVGHAENGAGSDVADDEIPLDLTKVKIESDAARKLLGTEMIKVRQRVTDYRPVGRVSVPKFESVDDAKCQERLIHAVKTIADQEISKDQIQDKNGIFVATTEDSSTWISRNSGIYKFTKIKDSMVVPTKFDDFKQAVQTALDFIGEKQLITLTDGEEIDILFISSVKNAMSTVEEITAENNTEKWQKRIEAIDPKSQLLQNKLPEELKFSEIKLIDEFMSDYYIGFGRRFHGIPVIGSQLVIRLDGNGQPSMVLKQWRKIEDPSTQIVEISNRPLAELIIEHPDFYERYSDKQVEPKDITIVDQKCGYMAAPANYRQQELRPGCEITFQLFAAADETAPMIIVALDGKGTDRFWGKK